MPVSPPPVPPAESGRRKRGPGFLKILGYGFGAILLLAVMAVAVIGLMIEHGLVPATKVCRGSDIPKAALDIVNEYFDLGEGEQVEFYYSSGLLSYRDDGQFVTSRRVGSWEDIGDGIDIWECRIEEIAFLELDFSSSFFLDSWITAETADGQTVPMVYSTEDGLDHVVADWLIERLPEDAVVLP